MLGECKYFLSGKDMNVGSVFAMADFCRLQHPEASAIHVCPHLNHVLHATAKPGALRRKQYLCPTEAQLLQNLCELNIWEFPRIRSPMINPK